MIRALTRAFKSEWLKLRRPGMILGGLGAMIGFSILAIVLNLTRLDSDDGRGTRWPRHRWTDRRAGGCEHWLRYPHEHQRDVPWCGRAGRLRHRRRHGVQ